MGRLSELPNIGGIIERRLMDVGISTPEELAALGSREAFLRLRTMDPGCCLSCLNGLEGAIRGVRWHNLDADTKAALRAFFKSIK